MEILILLGLLIVGIIGIFIKKAKAKNDQIIHLESRIDELERRL